MELSLEQVALISGIVTVGISILSIIWVGLLRRPKPPKKIMQGIVFVGSVFGAFLWSGVVLPAFPIFDGEPALFALAILQWTGLVLAAATLIFKTAQTIYDLAWSPILEWLDEKVVGPIYVRLGGVAAAFVGFLRPKRE